MPSLTIKSMPKRIYRTLKQSARSHHRSMNGEILACLERTLGLALPAPQSMLSRIDEIRQSLRTSKLTDRIIRNAKGIGRP
jgi:antitoxin FitA